MASKRFVREKNGEYKRDVLKLLAILVENNIPIPGDMVNRYIRQETDSEEKEFI